MNPLAQIFWTLVALALLIAMVTWIFSNFLLFLGLLVGGFLLLSFFVGLAGLLNGSTSASELTLQTTKNAGYSPTVRSSNYRSEYSRRDYVQYDDDEDDDYHEYDEHDEDDEFDEYHEYYDSGTTEYYDDNDDGYDFIADNWADWGYDSYASADEAISDR